MKTEMTKITPALAETWLKQVPDYQRKIDEKQVKKLVLAITRNEWRENGATIVFNDKGELLDGQHRLTAISQAGKPVYSLVVRHVSSGEATFHTIGDEKPRRVTDFLRCTHVTVVAGACRLMWTAENKIWPPTNAVIPHADILKLCKPHTEAMAALVQPLRETARLTGQGAFCLFLAYYYTHIRKENAEAIAAFFARVGDGVELRATDPAFQLRKRFLSKAATERIPRTVACALILKALHLHLDGQPTQTLRWEPNREEFPMLRGMEKPTKPAVAKKTRHAERAAAQ